MESAWVAHEELDHPVPVPDGARIAVVRSPLMTHPHVHTHAAAAAQRRPALLLVVVVVVVVVECELARQGPHCTCIASTICPSSAAALARACRGSTVSDAVATEASTGDGMGVLARRAQAHGTQAGDTPGRLER